MLPQKLPVFHLRELSDPHAVSVGRNVLGHDIHRNLAKKHIRPDPRRRRNARRVQHVLDQHPRKIVRIQVVNVQIIRRVNEDLID